MDESRKKFIADCNIKSFYNFDTIYQYLSVNKLEDAAKVNHDIIFDFYVHYIESNVTQVFNNEKIKKFDIEFHSQYGWKINTKYGTSYLGKFNISGNSSISVGIKSYVSGSISIFGNNHLEIGSFCSLANGIEIFTSNINHPTSFPSTFNMHSNLRAVEENSNLDLPLYNRSIENLFKIKDVIIGNDVWIGRNAFILNGVRINDGCIVGAKSVVTKDCLPYGIYVGSPAKLIRFRFPSETIEQLLNLKWWDWSGEKITDNTKFFDTDLSVFKGIINELVK